MGRGASAGAPKRGYHLQGRPAARQRARSDHAVRGFVRCACCSWCSQSHRRGRPAAGAAPTVPFCRGGKHAAGLGGVKGEAVDAVRPQPQHAPRRAAVLRHGAVDVGGAGVYDFRVGGVEGDRVEMGRLEAWGRAVRGRGGMGAAWGGGGAAGAVAPPGACSINAVGDAVGSKERIQQKCI